MKAEFLSYANGKVKLKKENGSIVDLSLERLSEEDKKWIHERAKGK